MRINDVGNMRQITLTLFCQVVSVQKSATIHFASNGKVKVKLAVIERFYVKSTCE